MGNENPSAADKQGSTPRTEMRQETKNRHRSERKKPKSTGEPATEPKNEAEKIFGWRWWTKGFGRQAQICEQKNEADGKLQTGRCTWLEQKKMNRTSNLETDMRHAKQNGDEHEEQK
jgi:hypothetical protein